MARTYDPYVKSVGKKIKVRLVHGKYVFGTLLQSAGGAIAILHEERRMVIQKNSIVFAEDVEKTKKDDSSKIHLRRSK